jgi:hypothetical protein
MQLAKIDGHPTLVRDMTSKHIVQTDLTVVRKHSARAAAIAAQQKRDEDIAELKKEVASLKVSIYELVTKLSQLQPVAPVNPFWPPIGGTGGGIGSAGTPVGEAWGTAYPFAVGGVGGGAINTVEPTNIAVGFGG